jgi:exocyst complex protein 7
MKSNQKAIGELSALLKFGAKQLEDVFRDVLGEDSRPLEPLHYLTKGRLVTYRKIHRQLLTSTGKSFPTISEENISLLRQINAHVAASTAQTSQTTVQDYPTAKTYADIRGDYIAASLRTLAMASASTARKQNADAIYKPGQNGIGTYSDALKLMTVSEYNNICPIFAREEWGRMCTSTMRAALNEYGKTLRELNTHIQNNLMADCYLAYEIIGIVTRLAISLEQQSADLKQPIYDVLKPIRDTAKISLPRMLEDTRGRVQSLVALPVDAGSVPVTSEIMTRLQTLTSFLEPLSSVLTSLGDGMWSKAPNSPTGSYSPSMRSFDVGADGDKLFANYAGDMIETLLNSLDSRARLLLKSPSIQGVFIINNIAIIDRMIRSSELQPLLAGVTSKLVDKWRVKSKKQYLAAWSDLAQLLFDVQHTSRMRSSSVAGSVDSASVVKSMSSKEKDAIKEKFKNFNTAFDDLVAKHKSYRMEREAKADFARDILQLIEPMYGRFWERYHEIDKGKGKYVKYDKSQLSSILASLG